MSAEIVRPFKSETVVEFIERHGGTACTEVVAQRFGWHLSTTRLELRRLERAGLVTKALRVPPGGSRSGGMYDWTLVKLA